jgi:hypothetical protein
VAVTLHYLGTPYSRYEQGLVPAFQDAARLAARLRVSGIFCYCPIVHLHPLAVYGELDPMDLTIWNPHNRIMMDRCNCLIVAHMQGWYESDGIKGEIEYFQKMGRPIFDLDPNSETLVLVQRSPDQDPRMLLTTKDMPKYPGTLGPLIGETRNHFADGHFEHRLDPEGKRGGG